ncbi:MAG TPA: M48 family metalloprotease [Parcubacteria group bacterium]|nr:M48 family metalloprotease [Parcubacteria group bacterium]
MTSNIYAQADKNIRKTWLLMALFLVVVIGIGYTFSCIYGDSNILYIAVIFAVLMNVISYWYSDKIVLKLHKAIPVTRDGQRDLYNSLENLAITAGLPMPRLYIIEDAAPNAFATGRDKDHAVVCVTTGLLHLLNKNELEGVLAHELSHIGNRDILISTVVVVLAGFITILSDIFLRSTMHNSRDRDSRAGGMMFVLGLILAILAPIAATLIQLAISRKREFLADASGALLTRFPEGLASALRKINTNSISMKTANTATAHMFIANPFARESKSFSFVRNMFLTHPPLEDRVKALVG